MLGMLVLLLVTSPVELKKCMLSCERTERYGKSILQCWYDEQTICDAGQPECHGSDLLLCSPRVVHLGYWTVSGET